MSEPPRLRHRLRSFRAVFAGLLLNVVLSTVTDLACHSSGVFPPPGQAMAGPLWVLALAYRIAYGVAGCWLAARLAPARPMAHAMALGIVGVVLSTAGLVATWGRGPAFGPAWYPLSLVLSALPTAWLGGWLHTRRAAARARLA